jgi:hypothetical protein
MIDLIIALDIEVKYSKWLNACPAACRLNIWAPADTRKVFTQIYRAFASKELFAYEVAAHERSL